jgi:hypothetical protein
MLAGAGVIAYAATTDTPMTDTQEYVYYGVGAGLIALGGGVYLGKVL